MSELTGLVSMMCELIEMCDDLAEVEPDLPCASTWEMYSACWDVCETDDSDSVEGTSTTLERSDQHITLVQLCEATARRIVQSQAPKTYRQICKLDGTVEGKLVRDAMLEECMWMIEKRKVIPRDKRDIKCLREMDGKWVVKYKETLSGLLDRVRARWVLRGDRQKPHVDYNPHECYSPVASRSATLSAFVIAVQYSYVLFEMDESKAFMNTNIDREDRFIKVPVGCEHTHPDLWQDLARGRAEEEGGEGGEGEEEQGKRVRCRHRKHRRVCVRARLCGCGCGCGAQSSSPRSICT